MTTLSTEAMEQICSLANIRVKPTRKQVTFYNHKHDIQGWDVRHDGSLVGTYCVIDDVVRCIYPRGSEYTHASLHGSNLTYEMVLRSATRTALSELEEMMGRQPY